MSKNVLVLFSSSSLLFDFFFVLPSVFASNKAISKAIKIIFTTKR
jgi:hypothetical protein